MGTKIAPRANLSLRPQIIWWKIIAGPPGYKLDILQEYDLIFDDYDRRIRKLDAPK